jgi:hypothetical protein
MRRVLTVLAIAAAVGGCDDDDGGDPRSEFQKRADRICLRSGIRPKAVPKDMAQAVGLLAEEARLRAAVRDKLEAIEPPAERAADYARFLRLSGEVADALRRMSALARREDRAGLAALGRRTGEVERERQRLGERLGFVRCGRPITESPLERDG